MRANVPRRSVSKHHHEPPSTLVSVDNAPKSVAIRAMRKSTAGTSARGGGRGGRGAKTTPGGGRSIGGETSASGARARKTASAAERKFLPEFMAHVDVHDLEPGAVTTDTLSSRRSCSNPTKEAISAWNKSSQGHSEAASQYRFTDAEAALLPSGKTTLTPRYIPVQLQN